MVRRSRFVQNLERQRQELDRENFAKNQEKRVLADRKRQKSFPVSVQILTGRKIQLMVNTKHDTVEDVKKKIQVKEGIHPDQMILLSNGLKLKDNINHLQEGACLFLTLRNRGG